MKILAIETSTLTGSVALLEDEAVLGEITLSVSVQHSERLMPAIEQLLSNARVDLSEIDLFAVTVGPGSFTGLRIGIAAVQGLAMAGHQPILGVSTLQSLAYQGIFFPGLIVPCLNAYRGEIYWGLYQKVPGSFWCESVLEDCVTPVAPLLKELSARGEKALLLGNGYDTYRDQFNLDGQNIVIAPSPMCYPKASHTAFLALQRWQKGERDELVLPRYFRVPG